MAGIVAGQAIALQWGDSGGVAFLALNEEPLVLFSFLNMFLFRFCLHRIHCIMGKDNSMT